jgi:hypothetical protein
LRLVPHVLVDGFEAAFDVAVGAAADGTESHNSDK